MPVAKKIRVALSLWALLLFLLTILGSGSLLHSPIQPLYLISGVIAPSLFFLLFTLLRAKSLFGSFFIWISERLPERFKPRGLDAESLTPKQISKFIKLIAHLSWATIFLGISVGFLIHFAIRQYDFILSSTLFPNNPHFYQTLISGFDLVPKFLGITPITPELIHNTLAQNLHEIENAKWARWILLIVIFYGFIPRALLMIMTAISLKFLMKNRPQASPYRVRKVFTALDKAKTKPVIERSKKRISSGSGQYLVALDFAHEITIPNTVVLNHREEIQAFTAKLTATPAEQITLLIDAALTPDRGLLRRIIRLLNATIHGHVALIGGNETRRKEWSEKLLPLLRHNETIAEYKSLDTLPKTQNAKEKTDEAF